MPLYFAYGSNLLTHRLTARCPSARALGPGVLAGTTLAFSKYSFVDGSGKATITTSGPGTHGVVYDLSLSDLATLDTIEGVGKGYERETITLTDGTAAETYAATDPVDGQSPFDWYLALILAGTIEHALPDVARAPLTTVMPVPDPEPTRPGRAAALAALAAAGWPDLGALLTRHGVSVS